MKRIRLMIFFFLVTILGSSNLYSQTVKDTTDHKRYRHSIDFCPISPLIGIYAIHYSYKITPKNEIIVAPSYMNIKYEDIGHTNAPGFIVGYRRYLWRNLHIDYQLMPMWDQFYEQNEDKTYPVGFDLWNEFRLGYAFDFKINKVPLFLNIQWPFGFALYSDPDGKPESFKQHAEENPFFYFPPLFFLGIRF
jgi:hypothetical protein